MAWTKTIPCVSRSFMSLLQIGQNYHRHGLTITNHSLYLARSISTRLDKNVPGIQKLVSPLISRRTGKKKKDRLFEQEVDFTVSAYASGEECDIEKLSSVIQGQGLYTVNSLPRDVTNAIHMSAKYKVDNEPREIFVFREGSVVFWNVPTVERYEILKIIEPFVEDMYGLAMTKAETEEMNFVYTEEPSKLVGDEICLQNCDSLSEEQKTLVKYAYSNALALSVKLGIWEASLERYIDSIEWVTEYMKKGKKLGMSRSQMLRKTGELYTLRHLINLSSDLLDTPDFYWDRENLESHYLTMMTYFNINRRTVVMNEKMNYCCQLAELLNDHLNDEHHTRLEWMIIILIMVEVVFEVVHTIERYYEKQAILEETRILESKR